MTEVPRLDAVRREYTRAALEERDVDADPLKQLSRWLEEAIQAGALEPTAMTLSTVGSEGEPSSRIVLLKGIDHGLVFYTNYGSQKAHELWTNPRAAISLFWPSLERQVRVLGMAERVSEEMSDAYFASRPRDSQLGAWASAQSQTVPSRTALEDAFRETASRFAAGKVPRPPHWGGIRVVPRRFEFWQGRADRMHDRIVLEKNPRGDAYTRMRLAP